MTATAPESSRALTRLARLRVPLGFLSAALVFWAARPTSTTLLIGAVVACAGEALRVWAAGHLNKSREVTASGPYRWLAHPLYVGSSIMGIGLAIATWSVWAALAIAVYLSVTLTAAIRSEEAALARKFGDRYDRYRRGTGQAGDEARRRFRVSQAMANREYRAMLGLLVAMALLALKRG
jgi:protein-S-isoprenylcysteine O-methyltransferase Ste14